jgi:ABC-type multidrug transport system fused ATPase/permease subunit
MQEPVLFNYTITENILYGKMDATNKEITDSAEAANCTGFVVAQKDREEVDESIQAIIKKFEDNKDEIIRVL